MNPKGDEPEVDQTKKGERLQSTLNRRRQTHPGMLPQFLALEVATADTLRVSTKRVATGRETTHLLSNTVEGRGQQWPVTAARRERE